ncbi:MAG: SIS domain-containing protein [Gemmatimonadota bacterium]
MSESFAAQYLAEMRRILDALDPGAIDAMAYSLAELRDRGGRLFFLGVGGGAAHASHAVCDFRKIAGFEAYTPADNVAELTARVNDEGWETPFVAYLRGSRLTAADGVFVFSVGGGSEDPSVSANLVRAVAYAKEVGARVYGVVGRDGGYTASRADHCVIVPTVNPGTVTPHTESMQAAIWHLLVSHPALRRHGMKWESLDGAGKAVAGKH